MFFQKKNVIKYIINHICISPIEELHQTFSFLYIHETRENGSAGAPTQTMRLTVNIYSYIQKLSNFNTHLFTV